MPTLTRLFIKASLIYLALAFLSALALAVRGVIAAPAFFGMLTPVYFHMFLVGWVTQLIFGVVYWMFPKYSMEQPRGSETVAWAVFWLLNAGLLLRVIAEPWHSLNPLAWLGWLLALSALLQWTAGVLFVANTWPRVKER